MRIGRRRPVRPAGNGRLRRRDLSDHDYAGSQGRATFSNPYFAANQALVSVADGEVASVENLAGRSVADTKELYGIAFQREHDALVGAINEQLDALISDGTYATIYSRWFAGPVPQQFRPAD